MKKTLIALLQSRTKRRFMFLLVTSSRISEKCRITYLIMKERKNDA